MIRTLSKRHLLVAVCAVLIGWRPAAAQPPRSSGGLTIREPHAGDCTVTIDLPAGSDAGAVTISIIRPITFTVGQTTPFVAMLLEPLTENSDLKVAVANAESTARVGPPVGGRPLPTSCGGPPTTPPPDHADDRAMFEASGYLGRAFDNFAPNVVGNYQNPEASATTKWRWTAGVEAQYRLFGKKGRTRQFWLSTQTLHGVRTADVNCAETPSAAVCSNSSSRSEKFLFILEHASTMEAHIDAKFEVATLQADSDVPIKAYVAGRFGFLDLEAGPKVFNSDAVGVGITSPSGAFKGSLAQVGWGRSEQFQSNQRWNRLKISGVLVFDLVPSLTMRLGNLFQRMGGSSRFFIAINVDRNPSGPGPDSVQTYVGLDFDLRRVFGSFGG